MGPMEPGTKPSVRDAHIVMIWSHTITVIPARSNYMGKGCVSKCALLGFARKQRTTYILPNLMMKLPEHNIIVRQVVEPKYGSSFWARGVHIYVAGGESSNSERATGDWEGERRGCTLRKERRNHHHNLAVIESSTGKGDPCPKAKMHSITKPNHVDSLTMASHRSTPILR